MTTPPNSPPRAPDPDEHKGAVEGDHPSDTQPGNANAPGALDKNGMPVDEVAIAEDAAGARTDKTQG